LSQIALGRYGDRTLDDDTIKRIYKLRHEVFHGRLGWDIISDHGMEHDFFDKLNPIYVLARGDSNEIEACSRLLPTMGPYMLKDVFPQLLHGQLPPEHPDIWELSRFAVSKSKRDRAIPSFGLGETSIRMLRSVVHFAIQNRIKRYVLVTTVAVERLLRKQGFDIRRFGPPLCIGKTIAVACWFEVGRHAESAVSGQLPQVYRAAA
jgi:acyl homoserine lactone synthase